MESSNESQNFETISYAIKIKSELDQRISNHIRALKHLEGRGYSKKRWIQEAIKENLHSWKNTDIEKIPSDCNLNFTISRYTDNEVLKIVHLLKKLKIRTSKTDFFLEAILKKLEREEENTRKLFQNILKSASKETGQILK